MIWKVASLTAFPEFIIVTIYWKSAKISIDQSTFDQIARYNLALNATYLMVTNGINHYYCSMDLKEERYQFLKDIPEYKS